MSAVEQQFLTAAASVHRSPWRKLIHPGIGKFAVRWWVRLGDGSLPRKVRLFCDAEMTVVLPEVTSEAIYTYGMFDEVVTWMVLQSVREGSVVLDVGAHFGYFSLLCSRLAGPAGSVFAFEPSPSTFSVLASNAGRAANVTPINCAAGDATGTVDIADFGLKYSAWNTLASTSRMPRVLDSAAARRVAVSVVRLDDFVSDRGIVPDFVKIDAEKYEYEVVRGMLQTAARFHPPILLECGSPESQAAGELLMHQGYEIWVSEAPQSLYRWERGLGEATTRFKDILFRPKAP